MAKVLDDAQAYLEALLAEMPDIPGSSRELMIYHWAVLDNPWSVECGNPSPNTLLGEVPADFLGQGKTLGEAVEDLRRAMLAHNGPRVV